MLQKWEYCRLYLWGLENQKGKGYRCTLIISYLGAGGEKSERLSEFDKNYFPFNPFEKAFGILGSMGWELVSVEHGLSNHLNGGVPIGFVINTSQAIAFFKRHSESGQAVDEPRLKI